MTPITSTKKLAWTALYLAALQATGTVAIERFVHGCTTQSFSLLAFLIYMFGVCFFAAQVFENFGPPLSRALFSATFWPITAWKLLK